MVVAGAVVMLAIVASSCQDGSALGVSNGCDSEVVVVDAGVADISDDPRAVTIEPGRVEYVVTVDEDWEQSILLVATADRPDATSRIMVRRADATPGGEGEPDLVIAIAGESCPG